jgi:hypothetical protein
MSDITPERIAGHLEGGGEMYVGRHFAGWVDVASEGPVLRIGFTPKGKPGQTQQYRAVVLPGETVPIVLPRPSLVDQRELEGKPYNADSEEDGWQVCAAYPNGRPTQVVFGDSIVVRGSGHISTDEARRMAAALAAMADAVDAAQAEQDGGDQ